MNQKRNVTKRSVVSHVVERGRGGVLLAVRGRSGQNVIFHFHALLCEPRPDHKHDLKMDAKIEIENKLVEMFNWPPWALKIIEVLVLVVLSLTALQFLLSYFQQNKQQTEQTKTNKMNH